MRISDFSLYRSKLRCHRPFHLASGSVDVNTGIFLELRTECGKVGWGEATPGAFYTGETYDGCGIALQTKLLPAVLGLNPYALEEAHLRMNRVLAGNMAAKCAVDLAIHDLIGRAVGQPVVSLLGGSPGPVATDYSIGLAEVDETAERARALVAEGYRCIKLKVGLDVDQDVRRVTAVRKAIGAGPRIRLDANEGWRYHEALRALSLLESCDVELCEQPLDRHDWAGTARLRANTSILLAADESVHTSHDAVRAIQAEAFDVFNLKLMKCGGLWPARPIVHLARSHGIQLMIGGMVGESSLGVTAAAALARTYRFEFADLDADLLLSDQLVSPQMEVVLGDRVLSGAPGLGATAFESSFLTPFGV